MRAEHFFPFFSVERSELLSYLKDNRWWLLLSSALLLLVWEPWLSDTAPKIDTEVLINTPKSLYNWLDIGRQGGILTRYLLGVQWFNPYMATLCGYLLLCVAGILYGYLFWRAGRKGQRLCAIFGLLCFSAPIMTEQFYFQLQVLEIACGYILCALAVGMSFVAVLKKSKPSWVISIVCAIWSFSTYQAFVFVYVAVVISCFILLYQRWENHKTKTDICYGKLVTMLIVGFFAAFLINILITEVFFSSGADYLEGQIAWTSQSAKACILTVVRHFIYGFLGNRPFFTYFYGMIATALLGLTLIWLAREKGLPVWELYVAAIIGLQCVPFLLTLVMGNIPAVRTQLAYPMVLACDVLILATYLPKKQTSKMMVFVVTALICWTQISMTRRLLYTDEIRAQEDLRVAEQIAERISMTASVDKPVAFVGVYRNSLNGAVQRGELIGRSLFDMTSEVVPHYFWSGDRAANVLLASGFDFRAASQEQVLEARKLSQVMPRWPAKGSIVDAGEFVIVKLSEDDWQEELIDTGIEKLEGSEIPTITECSESQVAVDSVSLEDKRIVVQGWAILPDVNSDAVKIGLILCDGQNYYRLPTVRKHRPDLVSALKNGNLYEYAGYYAVGDIGGLQNHLTNYRLYVELQTVGKESVFRDTGYIFDIE